jgi:hypothetical protein
VHQNVNSAVAREKYLHVSETTHRVSGKQVVFVATVLLGKNYALLIYTTNIGGSRIGIISVAPSPLYPDLEGNRPTNSNKS